jgi:L-asparaginase II
VIIADVVRSGFVEGRHHGTVIGLRGGTPLLAVGEPGQAFLPRSAAKPLQAWVMLRCGLELPADLLALACGSHSGEPRHVQGVLRILTGAGLDAQALGNTADRPLGPQANIEHTAAGGVPDRLHANCSGKHAAMLATCVAAGWRVQGYTEAEHPLQRAILAGVEELTGEAVTHVAVDGCGAPAFAVTPSGLARAFAGLNGTRVADAMLAHPLLVGGTGRDVTALLAAGILAKDGAEGVYALAVGDVAVVVKIEDGASRARLPVLAEALRVLGVPWPEGVAEPPVLGGGRAVGQVVARRLG